MYELFSHVLLRKGILLLLCLGLYAACENKPVSLSVALYNTDNIVTYSNLLSSTVLISSGAQACFNLVPPGDSAQTTQVKLQVDTFNKLGKLVNCYKTGTPVYDAQCICSRGFFSLTDTSCDVCATNIPAYSTVFCKSGTNSLSSIPSSTPGGYCCNVGVTVNPEYYVCDIIDQGKLELVITVTANQTKQTLKFDSPVLAQRAIGDQFNVSVNFFSLPVISDKRYVLNLATGQSVVVDRFQINGRGEDNPLLPGVTQYYDGKIAYTSNFALLFTAAAMSCPVIGSGTFASAWAEVSPSVLFRTRSDSTFPPLKQGWVTQTPAGETFYMGISTYGQVVMSDYYISSTYNFTGNVFAVPPLIQTAPLVDGYYNRSECYYMCPKFRFFGLDYKPCLMVCKEFTSPVYCAHPTPWQVGIPPFHEVSIDVNGGPPTHTLYWCTDFSGSTLGVNYVNVADPVGGEPINLSEIFTRNIADQQPFPDSAKVPISTDALATVESKLNMTFKQSPTLEPVLKVVVLDKDPHIEAYVRYGAGICYVSSEHQVFDQFPVSLTQTINSFEIPYSAITYSGNDTVTLSCGIYSDTQSIIVEATSGDPLRPSISYSPFSMNPVNNNAKSYIVKGIIYGGVAIAIVALLWIAYRFFQPVKMIKRRRQKLI